MTLFKIFVAVIQAYIFAVLSALYIGEAVKPKH
jgi:F0F1-type ATP synthase membrane subunit a